MRPASGGGGVDNKERYLLKTEPTYEAAQKAATQLQRQVDEDQHPKSNITVREAIEQWIEVAALEDTTRERYADLIRLYILPTFGHLQAAKLDAELLVHVVDGSDVNPLAQIDAVRQVIREVVTDHDGPQVPELLVVNKVDAASDLALAKLRRALP